MQNGLNSGEASEKLASSDFRTSGKTVFSYFSPVYRFKVAVR
jgi:hypothetical protein